MSGPLRRELGLPAFALLGGLVGAGYALVNVTLDDVARRGAAFVGFPAAHFVIDRVIPIGVGMLLGLTVHYLRLRSILAARASEDAARLRERLDHTARDQAVWVVAAATLHEAKNPLHAMGLLLDELRAQEGLPGEAGALVEKLGAQFDRVLAPLGTLKEMTRGGRPLDGERAPVARTVEDAVRTFTDGEATRGKPILIEAPRTPREDAVPAIPLRIALENLLANALAAGSKALLRYEDLPRAARIEICDDGPGVEDPSTLFRPAGSAKREGLGLGLPIARALVVELGGTLTYARASGPWATVFRVEIPWDSRP